MNLQELVIPILADMQGFNKGIDSAKLKAESLNKGLSNIGAGIFGVGLAGIGALTAITVDATKQSQEWGETLDGIGDILGTTSQESAGLALMVKRVGGSTDTLTNSMKYMAKGLEDGKGGLGAVGLSLQKLGIDVYDTNGNMRDSISIFGDVSDVIGNMPDGLEKTALMTEILGKSGADLGDVLGASANGGLSAYRQEAEKLGLAFDDKKTQQAIDYGKAQERLDATLLGLKTTIGTAILPIITKFNEWMSNLLADPNIQANIQNISNAIATFVGTVITNIPNVLITFQNIVSWLQNNQPVIVGILTALGVTIAVFAYSSAVALWAMMTPLLPIIAIIAGIALVVGLLYSAWTSNFLGIKDTLTKVWNDTLKPIFETVKNWLEKNIPVALKFLSDTWNNVLLPAITKVWEFLKAYIFPIFEAIGRLVINTLVYNFKVLSAVFTQYIVPALKQVYQWLNDNVFPVIKKVAEWVGQKLSPAFEGLKTVLKSVGEWFKKLADGMGNLKLPSWLTPGSPFPFTYALMGLNDELRKSANQVLPEFSTQLNVKGNMPNMSSASERGVSNNNSDIVSAINNQKSMDERVLAKLIAIEVAKIVG